MSLSKAKLTQPRGTPFTGNRILVLMLKFWSLLVKLDSSATWWCYSSRTLCLFRKELLTRHHHVNTARLLPVTAVQNYKNQSGKIPGRFRLLYELGCFLLWWSVCFCLYLWLGLWCLVVSVVKWPWWPNIPQPCGWVLLCTLFNWLLDWTFNGVGTAS